MIPTTLVCRLSCVDYDNADDKLKEPLIKYREAV